MFIPDTQNVKKYIVCNDIENTVRYKEIDLGWTRENLYVFIKKRKSLY